MELIKSVFYFIVAGIFEIGGGYLIWICLRDGKSLWYGIFGGVALIVYGVIPTLQPPSANFGRVYATYGGIFIVLSILWGWKIENIIPDKFDLIGGIIAVIGALIIMYAPRG
ncbi:YnfA family protein [Clostridium frigoris]|uniref:YnfA family protein n=1 Tax=Clostridium frigoris TaxID=205327 RepID=A0ABS6BTU4_9CLOT|nr:YnfA family protein [Clostridium frigoris]MBU3160339.1 YnfA family protein [Clostridium frigoris]